MHRGPWRLDRMALLLMAVLATTDPAHAGPARAGQRPSRAVVRPTAASMATPTSSGFTSVPTYIVGAGDVLDVEVHAGGQKQEQFTAQVSPAGTLDVPSVGAIAVAGYSAPAIAERLAMAFSRGYYVHPHVTVTVKDYAGKVYVLGEVRHPGPYAMHDGLTLWSACDMAGGLTDFAAPHHVHILRVINGRPVRLNVNLDKVLKGEASDVALLTGDRVQVPHRWF